MARDIRLEDPAAYFGTATGLATADIRVNDPAAYFGTPSDASTPTAPRAEPTGPGADVLRVAGQIPSAILDTVKSVPGTLAGMVRRGGTEMSPGPGRARRPSTWPLDEILAPHALLVHWDCPS